MYVSPIVKIAAHSAYDMYSLYEYLVVSLFFSHLGFWSGNLFLIATSPDLCLLVPFHGISTLLLVFFFVCPWVLEWESFCYCTFS